MLIFRLLLPSSELALAILLHTRYEILHIFACSSIQGSDM